MTLWLIAQLDRPVIMLPRSRSANEFILVNTNNVSVSNAITSEQHNPAFDLPGARSPATGMVLLDTMSVVISGLSLTTSSGWALFQQPHDLMVHVTRCLQPCYMRDPAIEVAVELPDTHVSLDRYAGLRIKQTEIIFCLICLMKLWRCVFLLFNWWTLWLCAYSKWLMWCLRASYVLLRQFVDENIGAIPDTVEDLQARCCITVEAMDCVNARPDMEQTACSKCNRVFTSALLRVRNTFDCR